MTRPSVSVALATYQGARFVAEQVRSILEQSHPVDEIVLGDDGSTDGTIDLVRGLVGEGRPGPTLVELPVGERSGVAANFSRVLAATTGDLVVLSDQDDVWHPDRVVSAVERFAAEPGLDVLFGDARLVDAEGRDLGGTLFDALPVRESELVAVEGGDAVEVFLRRNLATGATMSVRRRAIERALPMPDGWIHDEWLATTTALAGSVGVERRALIDYRQHGANVIGVSRLTLPAKIGRMRAARGDRNRRLARAFTGLADWAEERGVPDATTVRAKADFEAARARLPATRVLRGPGILALLPAYARFASQGRWDIVRDLVQPR